MKNVLSDCHRCALPIVADVDASKAVFNVAVGVVDALDADAIGTDTDAAEDAVDVA